VFWDSQCNKPTRTRSGFKMWLSVLCGMMLYHSDHFFAWTHGIEVPN
jgi:hypothetical protein